NRQAGPRGRAACGRTALPGMGNRARPRYNTPNTRREETPMAKAQNPKSQKTNAMRVLDAHRVAYEPHYYSPDEHSADGVAAILGVPADQVFKTLVVLPESGKGRPLLVLVPGAAELDLKVLG